MTKEIVLCGQKISYTLQYKSVKNINLRIRAGGEVSVSANKRVGLDKIEAFLLSKEEWIISAIRKMKERTGKREELFDRNSIFLFGKEIPLVIRKGGRNSYIYDGNSFCLVLRDINDAEQIKKLIREFYRAEAEKTIFPICQRAFEAFSIKNLTFPQIKYRYMKSRWGSCNPKKKILTFNTLLVAFPLSCVEYVVYHEFTHFLHPNHSKAFYTTLEAYMPSWKDQKRLLNEKNALLG